MQLLVFFVTSLCLISSKVQGWVPIEPPSHEQVVYSGSSLTTGANYHRKSIPEPTGGKGVKYTTVSLGNGLLGLGTSINYAAIGQSGSSRPTTSVNSETYALDALHPYEVPRPVPVEVLQPVVVPVERPVPVPITKPVPVPVAQPVYVKVPHPVPVPVEQPYPVIINNPVPFKVPVKVDVPIAVPIKLNSFHHDHGYGHGKHPYRPSFLNGLTGGLSDKLRTGFRYGTHPLGQKVHFGNGLRGKYFNKYPNHHHHDNTHVFSTIGHRRYRY